MKAESIEQIREHLAKGGRVTNEVGDIAIRQQTHSDRVRVVSNQDIEWLFPFETYTWQLLPLEEKEPVRQYYYRVNGCPAKDSSSDACICWHDEGTGPLKDHPERVHQWREKPVDHGTCGDCGKKLGDAERGQSRCELCSMYPSGAGWDHSGSEMDHGTQNAIEVRTWGVGTIERVVVRFDEHGDVWFVDIDDDDSDNAKLVLHREDATKLGRWLLGEPHGTQKGQEEKPKRGAWLEFADDGKLVTDVMHEPKDAVMPDSFVWCEEVGIHEWRQRIRTRLLHGQWPEMQDLMDWWEATTGERIEWGRRCNACECTGQVRQYAGSGEYYTVYCSQCVNGYSVRPTWMGDANG